MEKREKYLNFLTVSAVVTVCAGAVWLFFMYLFRPLLPFLLAWLVALMLRPMVKEVCRVTHIPEKVLGVFFSLLFISAAIAGLVLLCGKAMEELTGLIGRAGEDAGNIIGEVFGFFENIGDKLPFLSETGNSEAAGRLRDAVTGMVNTGISSVSEKLSGKTLEMIGALPDRIFFFLILIISTVFMSAELPEINGLLIKTVPRSLSERIGGIRGKIAKACKKWLKAYALILLITFAELSVGFVILRIDYPFLIAALVAAVDILPVLGAGSVLLPWTLILFIQKNTGTAVGMLILYVVLSVVRQLIEPKILGKTVGLPPVVTLIAMYVGFRLFGLAGMVVIPFAVMIVQDVRRTGAADSGEKIIKRSEAAYNSVKPTKRKG